MTVHLSAAGMIVLTGVCGADETDALLQLLLEHSHAEVDWRACAGAHTAVVQLLLAAQRPLHGPPQHGFLAQWVEPLLRGR